MIYDVFERIAQYLNINETVNFLLASPDNYNIYSLNVYYCSILLNKKILDFLDIQTSVDECLVYAPDKSKKLFKLYNYFRNHWKCSKTDYIIYMIDNEIDDRDLFSLFVQKCTFRNIVDDSDIRMVNYTGTVVIRDYEYTLISFNDMKYMLIHCNRMQLDILLNAYNIPVCLLSYALNEILIFDSVLTKRSNNIFRRFVKYMFTKHCFGNFVSTDNTYVHSFLLMLIKYKRTDVVKYFLEKNVII